LKLVALLQRNHFTSKTHHTPHEPQTRLGSSEYSASLFLPERNIRHMKFYLMVFAALFSTGCSRSNATPPAVAPQPAVVTTPAAPVAAITNAADLTVTSTARSTLLAVGDVAPTFRATTHNQQTVESSGGPRPRVLVVYFYPRDETPGCTREACAFRDASAEYNAAGADIVGVSTDTKTSHEGFARNHQLPFGLIADPRGLLAGAFGLDASGGYAPRVTFVIGRDGKVAQVFPNVSVDGHSTAVLAAVRASH
jgi:thioredoxin-dependent peroxiredoxin